MSVVLSNHLLITEILLCTIHYKHRKSVFSLSTLLQQVRMATCILAPLQRRRWSDRLSPGLYKAAEEARTKTAVPGSSLVVQWLRLHPSIAAGTGSIPGWGTKIPHASGSDGVTIGAGSPRLPPAGRLPHHVLCPWTVGFLSLSPWPLGRVSFGPHHLFSTL